MSLFSRREAVLATVSAAATSGIKQTISGKSKDEADGFFYVSDSFTIQNTNGERHSNGFKITHTPGVANQSKHWHKEEADQLIAELFSVDFGFVTLHELTRTQGINIDIKLALYDVTKSDAKFVKTFQFVEPYGNATNGMVANATGVIGDSYSHSHRDWPLEFPLRLTATLPNNANAQYQVGAQLTFFYGLDIALTLQYQYALHGRIVAA